MNKAWSEVILSKRLIASLKKENKFFDFEEFVLGDLTRVIGVKLAENGISLTNEIKSKIQINRTTEENGDVTYHAVVYVPEIAKSGT